MRVPKSGTTRNAGQALVELALVLLLLLLLVLGIFEFGRAMYVKNTLTHASRAGARAAIVTPNITAATGIVPNDTCNYPAAVGNDRIYQAVCSSLYAGINKADVRIDVTINDLVAPTGLSPGDMVEVKVTLTNFTAFVPNFIPVPTTLAGRTAMRYE